MAGITLAVYNVRAHKEKEEHMEDKHPQGASMSYLPTIIDVEASGFGQLSYPIEVGIADADGERFCTLIRPAQSWLHWDKSAEAVHHISRRHLQTNGKSVPNVAKLLNQKYHGQTLYSDGWVVDKPWLSTLFYEANVPMAFSVSALEMILSEAQMAVWHTTKDQVIIDLNLERHRASNDAAIIQETYRRTLILSGQERPAKNLSPFFSSN